MSHIQGVEQGEQGEKDQCRSLEIEFFIGRVRLDPGQEGYPEKYPGNSDGDIDEEYPPPVEILGYKSSRHRSDGNPQEGESGDVPQGLPPDFLRQAGGDHRWPDCGEHGRPGCLDNPGGYQFRKIYRCPADEGTCREYGKSADENFPEAFDVPHPPEGRQETAEDQELNQDNPGGVAGAYLETSGYRGHRDVDDADVECAHERGERD
jgi:hypothetical protein